MILKMDREKKVRLAAEALMRDDPSQYEGETLEQVIEQMKDFPESFLDHAIEWFSPSATGTVQ